MNQVFKRARIGTPFTKNADHVNLVRFLLSEVFLEQEADVVELWLHYVNVTDGHAIITSALLY